jgi:hypothetical protein
MPLESAPAAPAAAAVVAAPAPVVETPAPAVQATLPLTPAAPAAPAVDPNVVPIPKAMYDEFVGYKATVAKLEADRQAAEVAKKEAELKAQIEKGQIQEVLAGIKKQAEDTANSERAQRAAIEKRAEKFALSSQLATALASQNLVPGAAPQLSTLWQNEFVVEAAGDSYAVRTPSFQSLTDFVATKLASPEYAHFVRSTTSGGTGAGHAASQAAPTPSQTPPPAPPQPKNFGEAIVMQLKQDGMAGAAGSRDPRENPRLAMGLTRRSLVG